MKIEEPNSLAVALGGAFAMGPDDIERLEAHLRRLIGEPVELTYKLTMLNGQAYTTESRCDLDQFPFNDVRKIDKFRIEARSEDNGSISIDISRNSLSGTARGWIYKVGKIYSVKDSVESMLRGCRTWYSPIFWPPLPVTLVLLGLVALVPAVVTMVDLSTKMQVTTMLSVAFAVAAYLISKYFLFNQVVLMFGAEKVRQENLSKTRAWIFGVGLAGLLGVIAKAAIERL